MKWEDREPGPTCFCGMPTCVVVSDDRVDLLCIFHEFEAGAMFPLPKNNKPENWPNMTDDEMKSLVDEGIAEQERQEMV